MERTWSRLCLAAAALLYAGFALRDLTRAADTTALKYLSVLCCFAAALPHCRTADGRLTAAALALTAAADWFLLVQDGQELRGVALFCAVQGLYALRLDRLRAAAPALLPCRAIPLAAFVCGVPPLPALALFYYTNLVLNVGQSVLRCGQSRAAARFCAGLVLLFCCDTCIGLSRLGLCPAAQRAVWLFYLPSLLCIASSSIRSTPT